MVLTEVGQLATEQEYEIITHHFQDLKQHISDCIEFEDFEALSSYDMTRIKELYFQKSALFWKMKVEKVQERMDEIKKNDKFNYQRDAEFCELAVKKFTYYSEQKQAELKAKGDLYSYDRHYRPVINNKLIEWKMRLEHCRSMKNEPTNHEPVKVIP